MSNKKNLIEILNTNEPRGLERVRLGEDQTPIVPFTPEGEEVEVHYCGEPEIQDYLICNGNDCVLCQIGRSKSRRILLPVYLPLQCCIGVLPVDPSLRPNALLPQLAPILRANKPMVVFVRRIGRNYEVATGELEQSTDGGEEAIRCFAERSNSDQPDLSCVYQTLGNEELAAVPGIQRNLALRNGPGNASKG